MPQLADTLRKWQNRLAGHGVAAANAPGLLGSLVLHGLAAALVLLLVSRTERTSPPLTHFVPVDLVALGERTTAPPAPSRAPVPQEKAMHGPPSAPKPQGVRPHAKHPPPDALEVRLRDLARLSQPDSNLKVENGASNVTATNGGAAIGPATYGVRDYIRAQVLRRWDFDLADLGTRNMRIALHIVITGRGTVAKVEIADLSRHKKDPAYRDIAIAARNAVLLSAPFKLPARLRGKGLAFTLILNPRDTLR